MAATPATGGLGQPEDSGLAGSFPPLLNASQNKRKMTILHAHSDPHFAAHLRADANAHPHSVDIAVGYFYLSGFAQVSDLLDTRPGKVRILIGRTHRPTLEQIAAGLSAGDTLALLANGGVRQGCRVDAGLTVRPLSRAGTAWQARCEPGAPAAPPPAPLPTTVLQDGYCRQPPLAAGRFAPTQPKNRGLARPRSPRLPCLAAPAHSRSAGATSSAYSRIDRCTRSAGTVPPKLGSIIKPVSPRSARMLFRRSATISGVPYATRSASRSS